MASKRDLVEAHGFNRKRLVSAFVSGAPQGRDVESVSRSRPVVAGLAVAGLLLGGSAIAGVLTSPLQDGWQDAHVVIGKQSAARYVTDKGTLYPVLNATSARLMIPSQAGFPVIVVDDAQIAASTRGAARGILGAPDDLPAPARLLQAGWVACLDGTRIVTTVAERKVPNLGTRPPGMLVSTEAGTWLLVGGYRFPVPPVMVTPLRRELGMDRTAVTPVPGRWLDLLAPGQTLGVSVPRKGQPLPTTMTLGGKVQRVGQVVSVRDQGVTTYSLVVEDGTVTLTAFAANVYQAQEPELGQAVVVTASDLATVPPSPSSASYYPAEWPSAVPVSADGVPCAVLETTRQERAADTRFVVVPSDSAFASRPTAVTVDPGRGALVRVSSTGATGGPVYLVDQSGQKFAITDPSPETLARLGYAKVTIPAVPGPWILLFPSGPALSTEAALGSPTEPQPAAP